MAAHVFSFCTNSFAAGRMSASLSGGNVTRWTTAATDRMNPLIAVSTFCSKTHLFLIVTKPSIENIEMKNSMCGVTEHVAPNSDFPALFVS